MLELARATVQTVTPSLTVKVKPGSSSLIEAATLLIPASFTPTVGADVYVARDRDTGALKAMGNV